MGGSEIIVGLHDVGVSCVGRQARVLICHIYPTENKCIHVFASLTECEKCTCPFHQNECNLAVFSLVTSEILLLNFVLKI